MSNLLMLVASRIEAIAACNQHVSCREDFAKNQLIPLTAAGRAGTS
jgi:hypothetical protein